MNISGQNADNPDQFLKTEIVLQMAKIILNSQNV